MELERLDKILCGTGSYSRSEARALIMAGGVTADGVVLRRPETKVSRSAEIRAAGQVLDTAEFVYYMLNKPAGYVSASKPEGKLPAVTGLMPAHLQKRGLFCAGRLDADVTGLLLLTDDGAYAHRVTSPRSSIPKTYEVSLDAPVSEDDAKILAAGVTLRDGSKYRPARLTPASDGAPTALVTVTEGRYHEVKHLMAVLGRRVTAMRRLAIGALALDEALGEGAFRQLTESEAMRVF